jgi:hypothetical protein
MLILKLGTKMIFDFLNFVLNQPDLCKKKFSVDFIDLEINFLYSSIELSGIISLNIEINQ